MKKVAIELDELELKYIRDALRYQIDVSGDDVLIGLEAKLRTPNLFGYLCDDELDRLSHG